MNNTIRRLPNGDFEVLYDENSPRPGQPTKDKEQGPEAKQPLLEEMFYL